MVTTRRRGLGQNFLVDHNILDVIERLAELGDEDVALEVGGGPGLLSQRLAARARHVHVVEIDERLRESLEGALAPFANVSLHFADALTIDLAGLRPSPTKVVANLPYSIAATVILRTIEELPSAVSWVVMVQREVGARLAAASGGPEYGISSVLAQLACEVRVLRAVSRTVFRPVPNVDSVLVGLRRIGAAAEPAVRELGRDAFAHRRKARAGSLALSGRWGPDVRERARDALIGLGHPPQERAERLTPQEFRLLAQRLAR